LVRANVWRDKWLSEQGVDAIRVPAIHVMQDADAAADGVMAHIRERLLLLSTKD